MNTRTIQLACWLSLSCLGAVGWWSAPADAADAPAPAKFAPVVQPAVYAPKVARDPFLAPGVSSAGKTPGGGSFAAELFHLQGILYHPATPSAMINNDTVVLNRPAKLKTTAGEVSVIAVAVTRDSVKLKVGENTLDLRMEPIKPRSAVAPPAMPNESATGPSIGQATVEVPQE